MAKNTAKFGINDILNAKSRTAGIGNVSEYTEIWMSPYDVKPSESNFYSQENIEELADSFLTVGQQQPTVLGRVNGEFKIVSGHRRNLANILNIERGHEEFKKVRYLYKDMTEAMFELSLLIGNVYNRELTAWEKTQQAQRLKEALLRAKDEDGLEITGKLRDIIAELMNESPTNIARMDSINNNATQEIKEEFAKGNIGVTTAYEAAKLPTEEQKAIAEKAAAGEEVRAKEVAKRVAEKVAADAQEKADRAAKKAEQAQIDADAAVTEAKERAAEAEAEAENARELKRYVDHMASAMEKAKEAAEEVVKAAGKVSETDTTERPKDTWTKAEWTKYTLCCLLEKAEHITEENLDKLQEILVEVDNRGEEAGIEQKTEKEKAGGAEK